MTGRRPSRGSGGDPWRGGRPTRPEDADRGDVEVVDVSSHTLTRPRKGGVSRSTALAAAALVGLLAAGFGVLGGKPGSAADPSGSPGTVADATGGSPAPSKPPRTPAVTPFRSCGSLFDTPPDVVLRVDGVPTAGLVTVGPLAPSQTPATQGDVVEIPADAVTQLWIGRDACANAWRIALSTTEFGFLEPIELRPNPELDPAFASQNRFDLGLTEHRFADGPLVLRAGLDFPGLELVATWPIRFLPFEVPQPRLLVAGENRYFPTLEGCDTQVTFRNGAEERHSCDGDLGELPPAVRLKPGTPLRLIFDGWSVTESSTTCRPAVPSIDPPPCWDEPQGDVQFGAPRAGDWILEISTCAIDGSGFPANRICGTWLVRVLTQARQG